MTWNCTHMWNGDRCHLCGSVRRYCPEGPLAPDDPDWTVDKTGMRVPRRVEPFGDLTGPQRSGITEQLPAVDNGQTGATLAPQTQE